MPVRTRRIVLSDKLIASFHTKYQQRGPDDCWFPFVMPSATSRGYWKHGKITASRLAYVIAYGEPSDPTLVIAHKCDNKACVNPAHLEAISNWDNIRDAQTRGLHISDKGMPSGRMTDETVIEIRRLFSVGYSVYAIAEVVGFPYRIVRDAVANVTWKHLPPAVPPDPSVKQVTRRDIQREKQVTSQQAYNYVSDN